MKQLLSIWFLFILAFSLFGYRLVIDALQQRQEATISVQIDEEAYAVADLVSLKVPATLPYYTNSAEFQHIVGEVQMDGIIYRYVKRRIYNDSIEYLCLKDICKTKLVSAREQFYQLAYDLQVNKSKESSKNTDTKPLMLEYCALSKTFLLPAVNQACLFACGGYNKPLPCCFGAVPAQPPETLLLLQLG